MPLRTHHAHQRQDQQQLRATHEALELQDRSTFSAEASRRPWAYLPATPTPEARGFLAIAGFHTLFNAIWASLHKTPPDAADCLTDAVGLARSGGYGRWVRRTATCGTWTIRPRSCSTRSSGAGRCGWGQSVNGQLLALNQQHWGRVEPLVEQAWAVQETDPVYDTVEQIVAILGLQVSVPAAMLPLPGTTYWRRP